MPISRNNRRLKQLQELAQAAGKVKVKDLTCSQGHSPWQMSLVPAAEDLCQDCVQIWQQHQHPFGQRLPTFVLMAKPNSEPLPALPPDYAGQDSAAPPAAAAAAVDTGWSSTQYDGFGPMDEGVSMVRASGPRQLRLWR
jgi:hypothetical protein